MSQEIDGFASINEILTPLKDAKISLIDRGFLFGHSIFETIKIQENIFINWDLHYERLKSGCDKIFVNTPNEKNLKLECEKVFNLYKNTFYIDTSVLKIIITPKSHGINLLDSLETVDSNIYIFCSKMRVSNINYSSIGIKLKSFLDERTPSLIEIKSCNYLFNFLTLKNAKLSGFDDAIYFDDNGFYTECTTSSFLWFDKSYTVYSCVPKQSVLMGTSLMAIVDKLKINKVKFSFGNFCKYDINKKCVGAAVISSVRGFLPVHAIDECTFDLNKHKDFTKFLENISR